MTLRQSSHRPLLLLWGPPGVGKSTVGRAIAERLGLPFDDLDGTIARSVRGPISDVFARHGEAHFRRLEREELVRELTSLEPRVLALGGGALLDPELRRRARAVAFVVGLTAALPTLVARVRGGDRPLLGAEPESRLPELLSSRAAAYADVDAEIDTEGLSVEEVAAEVGARWSPLR